MSRSARPRLSTSTSAVLVSAALALAAWGASAAILLPNWAYVPGGGVVAPTGYSAGVPPYWSFLTSGAGVRRSADFWRDIDRADAAVTAGAPIGLAADAPPDLVFPWMGHDFAHPLEMVPHASTVEDLSVQMRRSGVRYLLVGRGALSDRLARDPSHHFEQVLAAARCLDYNSCGLSELWVLVR